VSDEGPPIRLCIVCQETELAITQRQTCTGCLNRTRIDLNAIVDGYALLPMHLHAYATRSPGAGEGGSRDAETPLMGGDVLSLIGYGSMGASQKLGKYVYHWHSMECEKRNDEGFRVLDDNGLPTLTCAGERWFWQGPDHAQDQLPADTPSILFELERWEADWRFTRGIAAAQTKATISNVTSYLHTNLGWAAAEHPAFDEFAGDMRRLRGHVERALGTVDRPVFANCGCIDCGERLARRWTASGLEDDWTCLGCRRTYTESDYYLAVEEHQMQAQKRGTA